MVLLGCNVVHVNTQAAVLRTAHTAILIVYTKLIGAGSIAHLHSLSKQFTAVLIVHKKYIVNTFFVKERQLVQGVRELGCSIFSTSLQPLDTFSSKTLQTQFTV